MLTNAHILFSIATGFYGLSLAAAFSIRRRRDVWQLFLVSALAANTAAVTLRYHAAWPMLPMYLGPVALPMVLGLLVILIRPPDDQGTAVLRTLLALILINSLAALFFPKDYYLPLIKSQTAAAHLFFWFGMAGRGCFLISAIWAFKDVLFQICLLYLHLTGSWSVRSRSIYAAAGAVVVLGLNCLPEMGPLRWPL